jgi:outer membrane receptor protein involved in Fe transport
VAFAFLIISILARHVNLTVEDTSGAPVAGAWVGTPDGTGIALTDDSGSVSLPDGMIADSIVVRSIGFARWTGPVPPEPLVIYLRSVPVPSGVVIPVTTGRRASTGLIPSTVHLESDALDQLSLAGLRSLPGVSAGLSVREYGGSMPVTSLSIRGGDPGQVSWFVDGHRIDSARDGSPSGILDPSIFGGMEISCGGGSAWSGGGLAGTVSWRSEAPGMLSQFSLGTDNRGRLRFLGRFPLAGQRVGLSIRRLHGTGNTSGISGSGIVTGATGDLDYGLLCSFTEGDAEDPDWALPSGGHRAQTGLDAWAGLRTGSFRHGFGISFGRMGYTAEYPDPLDDVHRDGTLDLRTSRDLSKGPLSLTAGGGIRSEWLESTSLGSRRRITLECTAEAGFLAGPVALSAAALGELHEGALSPGIRVSAGIPLAGPEFRLHVSAARSFHNPSFNDLYWPQDVFAKGNPDLKPETSLETEAGLTLRAFGLLDATSTAFIARTDDLIIWLPGAGGIWSPENISRALRAGLETSVHLDIDGTVLSGNFTWLDATDLTDGSVNYGLRLPYRPEYTWGAGSSVMLCDWLHVGANAFGSGLRFTNSSQTAALPPYTVLSGSARAALPIGGCSLVVYVTNALDEEYEETEGYPGQPRTIGLQINWMEE